MTQIEFSFPESMGDINQGKLTIPVLRGKVLGITLYRGYARLCDLADMSRADIYDQVNNPLGTQRDLSPKHAREAYEYVKIKDFAFWPEVFLCTRKSSVIQYLSLSDDYPDIGLLTIDIALAKESDQIAISRIDGNHRLHYGDGSNEKYPAIEKLVSFCITAQLNREEEIQLFKDINDNQKAMNTSHLDQIEVRLSDEEQLKRRNPELYIAQRLGDDKDSPFYNRVYGGGKKPAGVDIPLRTLRTGLEYLLSRSSGLSNSEADVDGIYLFIRNYFQAVKEWQPYAWENPREYLMLRGAGLWAICFLGAKVIDITIKDDEYTIEYMLKVLKSGQEWDWSTKGDFKGYSGRAGALEISKQVSRRLKGKSDISSSTIFERLKKSHSMK